MEQDKAKAVRKRTNLLYGVGINDADYVVIKRKIIDARSITMWSCPFYVTWTGMLQRCYSKSYQKTRPTYIGCSVVEDWFRFSIFKAWMAGQDWEGKQLDKDILVPKNKIYGPKTCVFVDQRLNTFVVEGEKARGLWPLGVDWCQTLEKFRARCCSVTTGKPEHIGYYISAEEAHQAWLSFKLKQAHILAAEQTDERIAKALIDRYENYGNSPKAA